MNLVIETLNNRSHQSWDIGTSLCSVLYTNYQQIKCTIVGHKVSHFCVSLIFFIYHLSEHTGKKEHFKGFNNPQTMLKWQGTNYSQRNSNYLR